MVSKLGDGARKPMNYEGRATLSEVFWGRPGRRECETKKLVHRRKIERCERYGLNLFTGCTRQDSGFVCTVAGDEEISDGCGMDDVENIKPNPEGSTRFWGNAIRRQRCILRHIDDALAARDARCLLWRYCSGEPGYRERRSDPRACALALLPRATAFVHWLS